MKKRLLTMLFTILGAGVLLYGGAVGVLWAKQDSFIFPQTVNSLPTPNPARDDYKILTLTAPDGVVLKGLQSPATPTQPSPTLVITFAGNAHDITGLTLYLKHTVWPTDNVVVIGFAYRGYPAAALGQTEGTPSQKAVLADAAFQVKTLQKKLQPKQTVFVGYSLGSSVAAATSVATNPDALVLVAPFTSMTDLAKAHYAWLPKPLLEALMRNPFPTADWVSQSKAPLWLAVAEKDGIIPPHQVAVLEEKAAPTLQQTYTLKGADHISIVEDVRLIPWLQGILKTITP